MKNINFKLLYARLSGWALPLLAILLIVTYLTTGKKSGTIDVLNIKLDSIAKQARTFENKNGQLVTENQQIKAESGKQLKQLTDSIFSLNRRDERRVKEVTGYTRIIQEYQEREKFAPFLPISEDTAPVASVPVATIDSNFIRVPRSFLYLDTNMKFSGRVTKLGVWLDSISIDNTVNIRTTFTKTGFLNMGRTTTVQVLNSNPAITTKGVTSITLKNRPNWWNRWGKPIAAAVLAGIAVDHFKK